MPRLPRHGPAAPAGSPIEAPSASSSEAPSASSSEAPSASSSGLTEFEAAVAAVLDALGPGEVVTYGEVAEEAGYPRRARAVGRFLAHHDGYPWWRVVTSTGRLVPHHERRHAQLLAAEGVIVEGGRVAAMRRRRMRHAGPSGG